MLGRGAIERDADARRHRVVAAVDQPLAGGHLLLGPREFGLARLHLRQRHLVHAEGRDAAHRRTAASRLWNIVSAVEITCAAAW